VSSDLSFDNSSSFALSSFRFVSFPPLPLSEPLMVSCREAYTILIVVLNVRMFDRAMGDSSVSWKLYN
jgi:hypothetical protein